MCRALLHDVVKKKINAELAIQKKVSNWDEILMVSIFVVVVCITFKHSTDLIDNVFLFKILCSS